MSTEANSGSPQQADLFEGASTSSAFGHTTTAQPAFGRFPRPQQDAMIFRVGQTATQPIPSLIGQPASSCASGFSIFGQTAPATRKFFGSARTSAFRLPTTKAAGGTKGKKYEAKSLGEQRMDDYFANRKGLQDCSNGKSGFFSFATQPAAPATAIFVPTSQQIGFDGFGAATNTNAQSGWLFSAKPTTGFGVAPAFDVTSQASTGFANFSMNNTAGGGGLFNSTLGKPAASTFDGFVVQTPTAPVNFNTDSSAVENTVAKPDELFVNTMNTGTANSGGLFGGDKKNLFLFIIAVILTCGHFLLIYILMSI